MRILDDYSDFLKARSMLPKPDGLHCVICNSNLPKFKRKYCSKECYDNWYKKHPILFWSRIKRNCLKRDNLTCQNCGYKSTSNSCLRCSDLNVHHIVPITNGGEPLKESNCISLCTDCHIKSHVSVHSKSTLSKSILAGKQKILEVPN